MQQLWRDSQGNIVSPIVQKKYHAKYEVGRINKGGKGIKTPSRPTSLRYLLGEREIYPSRERRVGKTAPLSNALVLHCIKCGDKLVKRSWNKVFCDGCRRISYNEQRVNNRRAYLKQKEMKNGKV